MEFLETIRGTYSKICKSVVINLRKLRVGSFIQKGERNSAEINIISHHATGIQIT